MPFFTQPNPGQSSGFRAYQSIIQAIPASTFTKITYQTEVYDQGGEYDPATSRFSAKQSGIYQISAAIHWDPGVDGSRMVIAVFKNGVEAYRLFDHSKAAAANSSTAGGTVMKLAAGDYIEIFANSQNALNTVAGAGTSWVEMVRVA